MGWFGVRFIMNKHSKNIFYDTNVFILKPCIYILSYVLVTFSNIFTNEQHRVKNNIFNLNFQINHFRKFLRHLSYYDTFTGNLLNGTDG